MNSELIERIDFCLKYDELPTVARQTFEQCKAALSQQAELISILESTIQTGLRIDAKVAHRGAEPVAEFVPGRFNRFPTCEWAKEYKPKAGDKFYLHPPKPAPLPDVIFGEGYQKARDDLAGTVPSQWYEAMEAIVAECEDLFTAHKDERERDGWDSPKEPQSLIAARRIIKEYAPLPKPTKGICNDERACPACYSGQGKCTNSSPLIGDCKNQDCDRLAPEGMYCEVCAEVAQPVASEIPCARCGGDCVEFTVPNAIWNAVIRPDGKERDDEYLCIDCWHRELDAHLSRPQDDISQYTVSCGCGDMFKPDSRGSAFIDIFGECENCRAASSSQPVASVPQDLREFIYTKGNSAAQFGDSQYVILVSDFEQFMAQRESAKPLSQGLEEFIDRYKFIYAVRCGDEYPNYLAVDCNDLREFFSTWMAEHARVPVELTGKQWSAMRDVVSKYADRIQKAERYEMASAYLDAAPAEIHAAMIAASQEGV